MLATNVLQAKRPRNVNAFQAAAILYGDWGTSKAYVIGLAFAAAGYSSFWLIFFVCLLNVLVALNYTIICKCYPNGGGVYSSVRNRSQVLALIGGFFLIADYIVTASLSALSAFSYLGVSHPEIWSIAAILGIGLLNFLGPKNTGNLAFIIAISSVIMVISLGFLSLPHLEIAFSHIQALPPSFEKNWINFVGIIVALSGVEAIANTTGVMQLDKNATLLNPSVKKTSTPAIIAVLIEVCLFTALFGLAVNALPYLTISGNEISAPGYPNVRDSMLRYMGEVFALPLFGESGAYYIGLSISFIFSLLLFSAVNTAIGGLNSLLFVMSHDGQLPKVFQKINSFGVPYVPLVIATLFPIFILALVNDMVALANLYAVGFVGAIATNLGSTSTDLKLSLKSYERIFMFLTFIIMAAIEVTLFVEKSDARAFVISIVAVGLLLRSLVLERTEKKPSSALIQVTSAAQKILHSENKTNYFFAQKMLPIALERPKRDPESFHLHNGAILCATTYLSKSLEYALKESKLNNQKLYLLFVREQKVMKSEIKQYWVEDLQACKVFDYTLNFFQKPDFTFLYDISDHPALNILEHANKLKVSQVILGMGRENKLMRLIRGNVIADVRDRLPFEIDLIVVS